MPHARPNPAPVLRAAGAIALGLLGGYLLFHDDTWRLGMALDLDWLADAAAPAHWLFLGLLLAWLLIYPVRHLRPWLWGATLIACPAILLAAGHPWYAAALGVVTLLLFDPAWLPPRAPATPEDVFYDGHCGLCHHTVRFTVNRDRQGTLFRYAPLQGEHIKRTLIADQRENLPDSIVVFTESHDLLVRSDAVLHLLDRIGGVWRVLSWIGRTVPRPLRDAAYDGIARIRRRLFAPPPDACPVMPPELRERFLA